LGEEKSGKSLLTYDWAGQCHKNDPNCVVVKFDTEFRDEAQLTPESAKIFGIDFSRFIVIRNNEPEIFDNIKTELNAMCQDGLNIPLVIIDSISALLGRRESNQETVTQHQQGDHAATLQVGLKAILKTIRNNKIALALTAHAKDQWDPLEVRRGNVKKPAAASAVKHFCEYIIHVSRNKNKDGRVDLLERPMIDEERKDMEGDGDVTGHKVKIWMEANTLGPVNRVAQFTLDYQKGIINQHEELFELGKNRKCGIERPNAQTYKIGTESFRGKPAALDALATREDLQRLVLSALLADEKNRKDNEISITSAIEAVEGTPETEDAG
jgi:RecA/RadA recombinase